MSVPDLLLRVLCFLMMPLSVTGCTVGTVCELGTFEAKKSQK